jgi:uncharacterized integral membrane protein
VRLVSSIEPEPPGLDTERPLPTAGSAVETGAEGRLERTRRHARRGLLYTWLVLGIAALVYLIALIVSNTRKVEISWAFGSGEASLVWIVVVTAIIGWVLGMATSIVLRRRTRGPRR